MSPVNSGDVIHSTGIARSNSINLIPPGVALKLPERARCMKFLEINFSIVSALVAGVPSPLPFIASASSSSSMLLPACSIRDSNFASLSRFVGLVNSSLNRCFNASVIAGLVSKEFHFSGIELLFGFTSLHPASLSILTCFLKS